MHIVDRWSFFAKWLILSFSKRGPIKEDTFELFIVEHTVTLEIMRFDHIIYLFFANSLAQFLHCKVDIFRRYFLGAIRIELTEYSAKLVLCEEGSDVDSSR